MVKLPSAIAACLCMALAFASPRLLAAEGLLKDPGFEGGTRQVGDCTRVRGSLPLNWSDNSCWHTEAQVSYEPVPLPARSGRALKVSLSRGRFQLVQPIELPLDAQLRAGVWMRADPPMVVKVGLRQSGPPYQEHGVRTLRIQDAWTWVEATSATHGLWDQAGRQALFLVTSATPGNLWLDEASLKVSPSTLSLPPMEVPPAYFGTHVHHAVNLKSAQAESGAGAVRIWDSSQSQWFQVQKRRPRPGQKNHEWGALDERVSLASQKGQELLMVLGGYAPAWASMPEGANEASLPECHRCSENPTRLSDWQNWVAGVRSARGRPGTSRTSRPSTPGVRTSRPAAAASGRSTRARPSSCWSCRTKRPASCARSTRGLGWSAPASATTTATTWTTSFASAVGARWTPSATTSTWRACLNRSCRMPCRSAC